MTDLEKWKKAARKANQKGNAMEVAKIIGLHLEPLFGNDHAAAHRFYTELEQSAPHISYSPMMMGA